MRRPTLPILLVLLTCLFALAACGGSGDKTEATATPDAAAAVETPPGKTESGCEKVAAPKPKGAQKVPKPSLEIDKTKTYTATVTTSCGAFEIALDVKRAPKTVASFRALAQSGFLDKTTFHRIVPGFVIQGGDPLGDGTGGPGYSVTEAPPSDLQYTRGMVAMAKTGTEPSGTSGSQFFVVTGEDAGLPPDYALLGKISGGADVVDTIGTVSTDPAREAPVDPVVIESVKVTEK